MQILRIVTFNPNPHLIKIARAVSRRYSMDQKTANQKLFVGGDHAKYYAQFRPTYPIKVFDTIMNFCKENSTEKDLAVDIGCGSGQSTVPLSKHFSYVIGVDVSEKQISNAPTNIPGLTFHVSAAEELAFVKDGSVDLITIGQALHWIQLDKFYAEVDRILKPGGSLVAYGYTTMSVEHEEVDKYLMNIYSVRLSKSWASDRKHIENKYSSLPSPYDKWIRNDDITIEKHFTVDHLIGYLSSWSAIQTYAKLNINSDLIGEIREKLLTISRQDGDANGEKMFKITWPVFMLMTHKPEC